MLTGATSTDLSGPQKPSRRNGSMNLDEVNKLLEYKDGGLYWKETNGRRKTGERAGRLSDTGYRKLGILGKEMKEHRVIFFMHHGYFPRYIDHINGNRQDNHIENLRECSSSENHHNAQKSSRNTSGYKNVHWHSINKKWFVRIKAYGVDRVFGYWDDKEFAILVAEEARDKFHGTFARHF